MVIHLFTYPWGLWPDLPQNPPRGRKSCGVQPGALGHWKVSALCTRGEAPKASQRTLTTHISRTKAPTCTDQIKELFLATFVLLDFFEFKGADLTWRQQALLRRQPFQGVSWAPTFTGHPSGYKQWSKRTQVYDHKDWPW